MCGYRAESSTYRQWGAEAKNTPHPPLFILNAVLFLFYNVKISKKTYNNTQIAKCQKKGSRGG